MYIENELVTLIIIILIEFSLGGLPCLGSIVYEWSLEDISIVSMLLSVVHVALKGTTVLKGYFLRIYLFIAFYCFNSSSKHLALVVGIYYVLF